MAIVLNHYSASSKEIVEKAVLRGEFKYPGICYIESESVLAWMTINNEIRYITGDKQITNIQTVGTELVFYSNEDVLFTFDISMSPDDKRAIIQEIINTINLDEYAKSADISRLLDDIVGDLGDKNTIVDYINSLSYNTLLDKPITNVIGTLSSVVNISSLDDGIYKVKGQFTIGGKHTTIQSSPDDTFFIVSHNDDSSVVITQLQGKSIKIFFIGIDGSYSSDRYITENWITEQDFISSATVREYVREIVAETIVDVIDQTLDERLDLTLDGKFSGIDSSELHKLFQKGE